MTQPKFEMSDQERRTQTRIQVQIPVQVTLPGSEFPVKALCQDVSWGGALLLISVALPSQAGSLKVVFPWKRDDRISAEARLLRARPLADGRYLIAVRFISLSPRSQSRLVRLLKMLRPSDLPEDYREDETLVRELEVTVNDADELRHMLLQIAKGHYKVTVFDAYQVDQSIGLSIVGTRDLPGIKLRARVLEVQRTRPKDCDWADLYTLALGFEHPRKSIKGFVRLLLDQLPARVKKTEDQLMDAPDWLRANPTARPTLLDRAILAGRAGLPCVLETRYPDALVRLTAGWGDVEAFEVMFRDLVLGDHGQPGGWPPDAWEELELLQDVHDAAYGMSGTRKNILKAGRSI